MGSPSSTVGRGLVACLLVCVLAGACNGEESLCDARDTCPTIEVRRQQVAPEFGWLSFAFDGRPLESQPLGNDDPRRIPKVCRATHGGYPTSLHNYPVDALVLECSSSDGRFFTLGLPLGDTRTLGVGTHEIAASKHSTYYGGPCPTCCEVCQFELPTGAVTVTVENAVGGPADYPAFVTPDFLRTFRVDIAFTAGVQGGQLLCGAACPTLVVQGSLQFSLSADHFVIDATAPCWCGN